jgi:hypothetical protein
MRLAATRLLEIISMLLVLGTVSLAEEPPVVPVGYDAYRRWDLWPQQRLGVRACMRSTYDRRGGNEGADASHFLYQCADDFNVALDVEGPGILYFTRYNHWHGSPWHYVVDGKDLLITETSTATPTKPQSHSVFLPEKAFPRPLAWTWADTQGADLSWVPIPFERSFQLAYSRTHYGTGYYIYHQFVPGIPLSTSLKSWNTNTAPPEDVLNLLARSGHDLLPAPDSREAARLQIVERHGMFDLLASNSTVFLATIGEVGRGSRRAVPVPSPPSRAASVVGLPNGPNSIRALEFTVPKSEAIDFGRARIRITWDSRPEPSVDAPIALFFGAGTLYNRDEREYLVKAFPVNIRFTDDQVHLACYFPMPFFHAAKFELVGSGASITNIQWSARFAPLKEPAWKSSYFHATYRDFPNPEPGQDLVLLDTREAEGQGDWSGDFVGNSWIFSDRANLTTLEGDPRFFFDDSQSPQAYGTGTEEWGGGGDYWGGQNMTLPFAGHPTGARNEKDAKNAEDKIESAYRFLLGDLMPFGKNAVIRLEHGGENRSTEHYQAVTFWYGLPAPSLILTDELQLGDPASEAAHQYHSPEASDPCDITSRYEWGVDTLDGKEIYPAQTDRGRTTTGSSEFLVRLEPKNFGVLLRRKLDYQFPNQRAEVFVADASGAKPHWKKAGVWYLAGGNTCVYSNPKEELGPAEHHAQTSNRCFRDDEFLIPRKLTEGKSVIRIKIVFTPVARPLFPGQPVPTLAWSEINYKAYCFVIPREANLQSSTRKLQ